MDNAATSFPKPPQVLEAMARYATELGASAGRGAYAESLQTGQMISECRRRLCSLFNGADPSRFIFTLNCTDALNLAIRGLADPHRRPHFICTQIDHNSILRPYNELERLGWISQTRVKVDPASGLVDPDDLRRAIRPDTALISVTHASNVTGTVQPLGPIVQVAREHGVLLLVDAAQSAGHLPIDLMRERIDLLAAPGHKGLLGPLGTGFLYVGPQLEKRLNTIREGGTGSVSELDTQPDFLPDRYESGSHNAIGLAGLLEGIRWVENKTVAAIAEHEGGLLRTFLEGLEGIPRLRYYGPQGVRNRCGVFAVNIEGLSPAELSAELEGRFGILTRPGIHCAPGIHEAIGTLKSGGATRFSFGPFLSPQDVNYATDALADIAMKAMAPRRPAVLSR